MVYCHCDLVLKSFCWACIDGLEVLFSCEVEYFRVVVLYRKNDYRISFISSLIIVSLFCVRFYRF